VTDEEKILDALTSLGCMSSEMISIYLDFDIKSVRSILSIFEYTLWFQIEKDSWRILDAEGIRILESRKIERAKNNLANDPSDFFEVSNKNSSQRSFNHFLYTISCSKLLSPEEEVILFNKYRAGDKSAFDKLMLSNLRMVANIARFFVKSGVPYEDLISEGICGLVKGIEHFDPCYGFKLYTYASVIIKDSIRQFIKSYKNLLSVPQHVVTKSRKVARIAEIFEQQYEREPTFDELMELTDFSQKDIENALYAQYSVIDIDSDEIVSFENHGLCVEDYVSRMNCCFPDFAIINESLSRDIDRTLKTLTQREADIVRKYHGLGRREMSLEEIGDDLHLTRERVRQIKEKAIRKLKMHSSSNRLKTYMGFADGIIETVAQSEYGVSKFKCTNMNFALTTPQIEDVCTDNDSIDGNNVTYAYKDEIYGYVLPFFKK